MKFIVVAFALLACAYADVSHLSGYNYQQPAPPAPAPQPERSYIPPPQHHEEVLSEPIAAPVNTYIPPAPQAAQLSEPIPAPAPVAPANTYIPPAAHHEEAHHEEAHHEEVEQHADDGYRYKTVRRVVYRHRA